MSVFRQLLGASGPDACEGGVDVLEQSRAASEVGPVDPCRRRPAYSLLVAVAVIAALLTACTPPPAPTPLPSCPTRAEVELEPPDPTSFSLPRAVSPDGTWVALTRSVGDDVVIYAREATVGAATHEVGSIPYSETTGDAPRVSVAADGSRVMFAGNIFAALAGAPASTLYRWSRATGTTSDVPPPVAASPPPGTPYPVNLRALSADGERAVWSQAFYQGSSTFQYVRTITDTATDAIISQQLINSIPFSRLSNGARTETLTFVFAGAEYFMTDLETFTSTSLTPALDAAQVAYPGGAFRPVVSSDDGRWTVLQRPFETPPTYVRWDHATEQLSLITQSTGVRIDTVDDAGTVVYSVDTGTEIHSIHRSADGSQVTVAQAPMVEAWNDDPIRPLTSADRRTTIYSEPVPVFGNRLVAQRCT